MMFFVPNSSIKRISSAEAPSLIDNMQMTAATPKMMPNEVNSDRRRSVRVDLRSEYVDRGRGGWRWHNELEMGVRPIPSVELQVKPQFTRETNAAQYVTTTGDMGFTPTFGRRYLFADLERRSASLETRIGVALSPDLTFQLYAQPLLSSGAYPAYKQLARSESFDFDVFERGQAVAAPNGDVSCVGGRICRRDETEFDAALGHSPGQIGPQPDAHRDEDLESAQGGLVDPHQILAVDKDIHLKNRA